MPKQHQLTPRQAEFVRYYVVHGVGALAAREAGYAAGSARITASQLLTKPNIQAKISAERRRYERLMGLSRQQVAGELLGVFDLARSHGSARDMIAALREVARICGYYEQLPQEKAPETVATKHEAENLEAMSNGELAAIIQK